MKIQEPNNIFYKVFKFFHYVFIEKTKKGHQVIKVKEWIDKNGRTHLKTVSNWIGNPFLSIGMPLICLGFIATCFLLMQPLLFSLIAMILIISLIIYFLLGAIFEYKFQHVWTAKNGWKITSLPEPADGIKRLYYNEYKGFKMVREIDESSDTHRWYAHNIWTGEHFEWSEKTKGKDFSVRQMNQIMGWLKGQVDNCINELPSPTMSEMVSAIPKRYN